MERGNTKHGPVHDEQLAQETSARAQGSGQRGQAEEWREAEPARDTPASPDRQPPAQEVRDRSELARIMTRDVFPATREKLLRRLADRDAPDELAGRVETLTRGRRFEGVHEVLEALGIASPETRREDPDREEGR